MLVEINNNNFFSLRFRKLCGGRQNTESPKNVEINIIIHCSVSFSVQMQRIFKLKETQSGVRVQRRFL